MRTLLALVLSLIFFVSICRVDASELGNNQPQGRSPENQFRNFLQTLETNGTKITSGRINFDEQQNAVIATDIVFTAPSGQSTDIPPVEFKIGRLWITGFSLVNGAVGFSKVVGDSIAFGPDMKLTHIEVGQSVLPDLRLFHPEPLRPFTNQINLISLFAKASIERASADGVTLGTTFRAERVTISKILDGKIAGLTFSKISNKLGNSEQDDSNASIATVRELTLLNVNVQNFINLFDDTAYLAAGAAKPWNNLIDAINAKDIVFKNGGKTFGIADAVIGPLKVRQFPQSITGIFDAALLDPWYWQKYPAQADHVSESFSQAFLLERVKVSKLSFAEPSEEEKATVDIDSLELENLTANHVDQVSLSIAKITAPGGTIDLGLAEFNNVSLSEIKADVERPSKVSLPTIARVKAQNITANIGDIVFHLDMLDVAMSYFIGMTPTDFKMKLDNARFPVSQIGNLGLQQTLLNLGYENVEISLQISGAWQDTASSLAFDTIKVTGTDMGSISISGSLTGISRKALEAPNEELGKEILAGGLQNFRLSVENSSLLDRFITQAAKVNGKTPDEFRGFLAANLSAIMNQIPSPQIRNKFVFSAISFINNPKKMDIFTTTSDVTPIQDIIGGLRKPYMLPSIMKLDASSNDRK